MEHTKISIIVNEAIEEANVSYDVGKGTIKFSMSNGFKKTYQAEDLYLCLAKIRHEHPEIKFLCKGAKLNVTPSRMCSQMSGGAIAYELTPGRPATRENIVQIFDYEDCNITRTLKEQQDYFRAWLNSLNAPKE
jgi:hypothetical protein